MHPEGAEERAEARVGGEEGGGGQQALHAHEVSPRPADGVHPEQQHPQSETGEWRNSDFCFMFLFISSRASEVSPPKTRI